MNKLAISLAVSWSIFLSGCATGPSFNEQISAVYTQSVLVFKACLEKYSFKDSPICHKEQLEIINELPPHSGQAAARRHKAKMYQTQLDWVAGRINSEQANAITQLSLAEYRLDLERQSNFERAQSSQQRANVSKALSDFSKATSQPPSVRCKSTPNISGGFDSVCQ